MAVDWNAIADKMGTELNASENLLLSEFTTASGQTKKYRPLTEIASAITIAKNQAAAAARETDGIMSRVEMDPLE